MQPVPPASAAAFLGWLAETHGRSEAVFLVDGMGYDTLERCRLRGRLNYAEHDLILKWIQTLAIRIDWSYQTWIGWRVNAQRWLTDFVH